METFCHFSENGRVEGLILDKRTPDGAKRPRSAKGDRRFALDGRITRTIEDMPKVDVNSINHRFLNYCKNTFPVVAGHVIAAAALSVARWIFFHVTSTFNLVTMNVLF